MTHFPLSQLAFQSHFRRWYCQNPYHHHLLNLWWWRISKYYGRIDTWVPSKSRSSNWRRVEVMDIIEVSGVVDARGLLELFFWVSERKLRKNRGKYVRVFYKYIKAAITEHFSWGCFSVWGVLVACNLWLVYIGYYGSRWMGQPNIF